MRAMVTSLHAGTAAPLEMRGVALLLALLCLGCTSEKSSINPGSAIDLTVSTTRSITDDFVDVVGAVRLLDGTVAVADRGRSVLRVFEAGTDSAYSLGSRGKGPGEFRYLHSLRSCEDNTLVAYDFELGRLSLFSTRAFIKQLQLPPRLIGADFVGCTSSDSMFFAHAPEQLPGFGLQTFPQTVFLFDADRGTNDWVTTIRGSEMWVSEREQAFYERPFGLRSFAAVGPTGLIIAESHKGEIQKLSARGTRIAVKLSERPSRTATTADRTRYTDELLAEVGPKRASQVRSVLAEADWGTTLPVIDRMIASTNGDVWIRTPPAAGESMAVWRILGIGAASPRSLFLPSSDRVLFIDSEALIIMRRDDSGQDVLLVLTYQNRL